MNKKIFSVFLFVAIVATMLPLNAFANILGVSCRTVEAWEYGKSTPTPTEKNSYI